MNKILIQKLFYINCNRNWMDNKENIAFSLGIQKNVDKTLTNSNKINIRASNINGLVNDLDMEK